MGMMQVLVSMLAGVLLGAGGAAAAGAGAAPAPARGPFTEVPMNHPAYAAMRFLEESGFFTGYPAGIFSGKPTLTRYEFAVGLQRVHTDLLRKLQNATRKPPPRPEPSRGVSCFPAPPPIVPAAVADPQRRRTVLIWIRLLLIEFTPELTALGSKPDQMLADLRARQDELENQPPPPPQPSPAPQ